MIKINLILIIIIIILIIILIIISTCLDIIKSIIFCLVNKIKTCGFLSYYYVYREIFLEDTYGFVPIKDNMVIFDVGSNIGLYNLYVNSKANNLKVYSFEPVPEIFNCLKNNVSNSADNTIINKGLGDTNKIITMNYVKDASALSSACDFDDEKLKAHDNIYLEKCGIFSTICKKYLNTRLKNAIKVKTIITTMDDIIREYDIPKIDILKIDVECYEYNVLKGISRDNFKIIKNIIIEVENFRKNYKNKIINLLNDNNFTIKYNNNNNKDNWITIYAYK